MNEKIALRNESKGLAQTCAKFCLGSQPGIEPDISKLNLLIECIHLKSVNVTLSRNTFPILKVFFFFNIK